MRTYLKQIPSKVALIQDDLSVQVLRSHTTGGTEVSEKKSFYSVSKFVPPLNYQESESIELSGIPSSSSATPASSLESSNSVKSNLMSSFIYRSQELNASFHDDFGSSSKQEKSGQRTHYCISGYFFMVLSVPIPYPTHPVPVALLAFVNLMNMM